MRLHEQGLVYRSAFLINWSPGLRTAISDLEVGPYACTWCQAVRVGRPEVAQRSHSRVSHAALDCASS